jgi:hypothetical protein
LPEEPDHRSPPEPDRRRERAGQPEDVGAGEERVEADEATHRRSDRRGAIALAGRPEGGVDERLDRVHDEREVVGRMPTAERRIGEGPVLVEPALPDVRDPDDDRLETLRSQGLEGLVDTPLPREARGRVEEVLPVVHVERRVGAVGHRVRRREVDQDVAHVPELATLDRFEHLDRAGDPLAAPRLGLVVVDPVAGHRALR